MSAKILAINEQFGYRPILVVASVNFLPQQDNRPPSTWFYGSQLMFQYDNPTLFTTFLRSFQNLPTPWCQLSQPLDLSLLAIEQAFPRSPFIPIANEHLTLVEGGKDPIRGYFLTFYGRVERLFTQPDWWKTEEYDS